MYVSLPGETCSKTTCDHMNSASDRMNAVPHVINAVSYSFRTLTLTPFASQYEKPT